MANGRVFGVDKLRTGVAVAITAQNKALSEARLEMAIDLANKIKAACPERTGALKETVKAVELNSAKHPRIEVWIGNREVDYAAHVEYGTSKMAAKPFIRPAVAALRKKYPSEIERVISQTWTGK